MKTNAAPSVIIVARHGARLDAEDANWQQNSPAPYDTPLSYGGWTQTRALGARIASLLHARELALNYDDRTGSRRGTDYDIPEENETQTSPSRKRKRRRHHVMIHSSPFVRCIQSSIAITAGMAQYQGNLAKFENADTSRTPPASKLHSTTPHRSQTLDASVIESRLKAAKMQERAKHPAARVASNMANKHRPLDKPTLRLDACLGEWLSPDYFEHITPPPGSKMMIAGAKAELLRTGTPIQGVKQTPRPKSGPPGVDRGVVDGVGQSISMADLARVLPSIPSTGNSDEEEGDDYFSNIITYTFNDGLKNGRYGYVPPQPNYSLRASEPIPGGYVAHARDACIKIDFQWDSMREPQNWGDGGEHGEEWSSMHRRFRNFLGNMVTWYKQNPSDFDPQSKNEDASQPAVESDTASSSSRGAKSAANINGPDDEEEEFEEDLVVVVVTHGAGCNALIGALTNQPVLLDVGMGSLTMAVRKDSPASPLQSRNSNTRGRRRSSIDTGLSTEYEMRLIASNEHLRAGTDPLQIPALMSPQLMPSVPDGKRTFSNGSAGGSLALALGGSTAGGGSRSPSSSGTVTPTFELEGPIRPAAKNSSLGSIRRRRAATSSTNPSTPTSALSTPSGSGLWGNYTPAGGPSLATRGTRSRADTSTISPEDQVDGRSSNEFTLNFRQHEAPPSSSNTANDQQQTPILPPQPKKAMTWTMPPTSAPATEQQTQQNRRDSQRGLWGSSTQIDGRKAIDST